MDKAIAVALQYLATQTRPMSSRLSYRIGRSGRDNGEQAQRRQ